MPNIVAPMGFVPIRNNIGAPYNGQHMMMLIPSGDSVATYIGDVVAFAGSSGAADAVVDGISVQGMPTVTKMGGENATTTDGATMAGVVVGFVPSPTAVQTGRRYRAASEARIALVCTDPNTVYEVQEATSGTQFANTDVGLKCGFYSGDGNTVTGMSDAYLTNTNEAATATLPVLILGLSRRVGSEFGSGATAPATYEVMLNIGAFSSGTGAAGKA